MTVGLTGNNGSANIGGYFIGIKINAVRQKHIKKTKKLSFSIFASGGVCLGDRRGIHYVYQNQSYELKESPGSSQSPSPGLAAVYKLLARP